MPPDALLPLFAARSNASGAGVARAAARSITSGAAVAAVTVSMPRAASDASSCPTVAALSRATARSNASGAENLAASCRSLERVGRNAAGHRTLERVGSSRRRRLRKRRHPRRRRAGPVVVHRHARCRRCAHRSSSCNGKDQSGLTKTVTLELRLVEDSPELIPIERECQRLRLRVGQQRLKIGTIPGHRDRPARRPRPLVYRPQHVEDQIQRLIDPSASSISPREISAVTPFGRASIISRLPTSIAVALAEPIRTPPCGRPGWARSLL